MRLEAKLKKFPSNCNCFDKKVVLPISVGQPYHETEQFYLTLQLIEKMKFASCSIIVADTLQRYNYQLLYGTAIEEAKVKSYKDGSDWIERNKKYLDKLSIPHEIIRWEECLYHKDFISCVEKITNIKETNEKYYKALERDVNKFIMRQRKHNLKLKTMDSTLQAKLKTMCLNYIIEETAVIYSYFLDKKYNYILYPHDIPKSVDVFIKNFINILYPELLHHFTISFDMV